MSAKAIHQEHILDRSHDLSESQASEQSNPLANVWLFCLAVLLGGTLLCTAVLVAWPILAKMFAG